MEQPVSRLRDRVVRAHTVVRAIPSPARAPDSRARRFPPPRFRIGEHEQSAAVRSTISVNLRAAVDTGTPLAIASTRTSPFRLS